MPYIARVALGGGVVQDLGSFISAERAALTAQRFVNLIAPQGPELVGRSIDVYWPVDGAWYTAEVRSVTDEGAFLVFYPADQYEEELMLGSEAWRLRFHASTVTEEGGDKSASGSTAHTWRRFLALERQLHFSAPPDWHARPLAGGTAGEQHTREASCAAPATAKP